MSRLTDPLNLAREGVLFNLTMLGDAIAALTLGFYKSFSFGWRRLSQGSVK
jgi:hypothetical protein